MTSHETAVFAMGAAKAHLDIVLGRIAFRDDVDNYVIDTVQAAHEAVVIALECVAEMTPDAECGIEIVKPKPVGSADQASPQGVIPFPGGQSA